MQMKLQRQHFLLSYFKTLIDGAAGVELTTSHVKPDAQLPEPPVGGFDWHAVISTTKKKIMGSQAAYQSGPWQVTPTTIILQYWTDLQVVTVS